MNAIRRLVLIIIIIVSYPVCAQTTPVQTVHFATDQWPPYLIADNNGKISQGVIVEIIHEVFARIPNTEAKIHFMPWSRALAEVKSGRMDALPGLVYSESRTQHYHFTVPIFKGTSRLIYNRKQLPQGFRWSSASDFDGLKVAAVRDYAMYDSLLSLLDDYDEKTVIPVISDDIVVKMVGSGRIPLGAINELTAIYWAEKYGLSHKIGYVNQVVGEQKYFISISKQSSMAGLAPQISKVVSDLTAEGIIDNILSRYGIMSTKTPLPPKQTKSPIQ